MRFRAVFFLLRISVAASSQAYSLLADMTYHHVPVCKVLNSLPSTSVQPICSVSDLNSNQGEVGDL